jgi:hypothetical protein
MTNLTVHDFSCLKHVELQVAPVTVLIGPQGSGKSVTTKLLYFFYDQLTRQYQCAEKGVDLGDFKKEASRQFRTWFPPSAWGPGRFNITFNAGLFTARVLRRWSKGSVTDDVTVTFSEYFYSHYESLLSAYADAQAQDLEATERGIRRSIDRVWAVRDAYESKIAKELGSQYISMQNFVPAGRAFFTSIGRLVAAFDQGSSIDPVTLRFAKLFAILRDRGGRIPYRSPNEPDDRDQRAVRRTVMNRLFGGEIKFERDLEFVETRDGRQVPFSALSSGQQELLPMWLLIDYIRDFGIRGRPTGDLVYIEEPEAHLFPSAQNLLMDYLIGSVVSRRENRSLILTTHSPYILSKLNNYLKAGQLGKIKRLAPEVARIISRDCWLTPSRVRAYAIHDGTLENLIDANGLIDGTYIDKVSEDVAAEFEQLLDLQFAEAA